VKFVVESGKDERAKPTTAADRPTGSFSLSLVVPMFNEEAACGIFFDTVVPILETITERYEIVCVDDGSSDRTAAIVAAYRKRNPRIKLVALSRNFGKEAALTAGLDHATGDAVIPIDVDLQDPPEVIPQLVEQWRRGCDTVLAVRESRDGDTFLKRTTARMFYRVLDRISDVPVVPEAGDFRLLDRKLVSILRDLPERSRFMKGMYAWAGFKQGVVPYHRPARSDGTTKFHYWKLWNFALDGLFSFSTLPLRIWTYIGTTVASIAFLYGIFIVFRTLIFGTDLPGYASVFTAVLFLGGINLIGLGVLGEYLGRVFMEVKRRPTYVVRRAEGVSQSASEEQAAEVATRHRAYRAQPEARR
jgi:glycosyltransferase involved in cell wall biosynthesis